MSDVLEQIKAEDFELPIPPGTTNTQIAELLINTFHSRAIGKLETDFKLSATDRSISDADAKEIDEILHARGRGLFFVKQCAGNRGVVEDFYTLGRIFQSNGVQEA